MAKDQTILPLPAPADEVKESPADREERLWTVTLRYATEAADEIGRAQVAEDNGVTEGTLSKQLREVDGRNLHGKLLQYLMKHQRSGRLAKWMVGDYGGFLPPQRNDKITPEEFAREVAAMALGGTFGRADAQKILALYERLERKPAESAR